MCTYQYISPHCSTRVRMTRLIRTHRYAPCVVLQYPSRRKHVEQYHWYSIEFGVSQFWPVDSNLPTIQDFDVHSDVHCSSREDESLMTSHVSWLIHTCDMADSYVWHDSFICVTWLIHICDMTHSYVWHDSFTCVTWLIHMCDMTHSYVWHDLFICATWLVYVCDVTHSHVRRDWFI